MRRKNRWNKSINVKNLKNPSNLQSDGAAAQVDDHVKMSVNQFESDVVSCVPAHIAVEEDQSIFLSRTKVKC